MIQIFIIYFLVGLCASILGSLAGLGGGVIIKPVLDTLGHYNVSTISVLSAATVFTMATVSLINARRFGVSIKGKTSLILAIGSIMGGIFGKSVFNYLIDLMQQPNLMSLMQSGILAILMLIIFVLVTNKEKMRTYQIESMWMIFLVGLILGIISSFLGIGGGPLNVAVLYLLFSMEAKQTIINSLFIIFFSQLSTLVTVGLTTGLAIYDLSMLVYMIVGAVLGGLLGTSFARKITNEKTIKIFNITIIVIFLINIYNMVRYFV